MVASHVLLINTILCATYCGWLYALKVRGATNSLKDRQGIWLVKENLLIGSRGTESVYTTFELSPIRSTSPLPITGGKGRNDCATIKLEMERTREGDGS